MISKQHWPQVAPAPVVDNPRLLRRPGAELGPGAGHHHHQSGQYPHHGDVCLCHLVKSRVESVLVHSLYICKNQNLNIIIKIDISCEFK